DRSAPIPLADSSEFAACGRRLRLNQFRVNQREKCAPRKARLRQSTIRCAGIQSNCPELMVIRLAHLHFCHPIKNFAGIKIAKDRSEEHTSELQSRGHLVCRLQLEKKTRRWWSRHKSGSQP